MLLSNMAAAVGIKWPGSVPAQTKRDASFSEVASQEVAAKAPITNAAIC